MPGNGYEPTCHPIHLPYRSLPTTQAKRLKMLLVILIILIVLLLFGGLGYNGGAYRNQGLGLVGVLLVILLILWLVGAFGGTGVNANL